MKMQHARIQQLIEGLRPALTPAP